MENKNTTSFNDISNLTDDQLLVFTKLFSQFDKTSLKLKTEFEQLQNKVDKLLLELEEKNKYLEEVYQKQQETNNLLFTLLENLTNGVILFDSDFKCILANTQATVLLGKDADELYELSYEHVFNFKYKEDVTLKELQLKGEYFHTVERVLVSENQEEISICLKTSVLEDEITGESFGFLYVIDDLSEVKKMEYEVQKNKSFIEIGQMSAGIAHEIRNPLGGISGFATMLARDLKDDPTKLSLVHKIQEGVQSLSRITSDVLTFNRSISPEYIKSNPITVIESCLDLTKSELSIEERDSINFITSFPKSNIEVDLDICLLKQVLINFIKNGVQSLDEKGGEIKIILNFNILKNQYIIEVCDNGCGISEEIQKKLFTPFFTTKAQGTGLGLAVTRKIVEALNGTIDLSSKLGKGSIFKITFPIKN